MAHPTLHASDAATNAHSAARPAPTREQLHMAYRDLYRPSWPATLDAALQSHPHSVALHQVAKRYGRPALAAHAPHGLPRLPAPPTPGLRELTGPLKHGRSPYSLATGPMTELSRWPGHPNSKAQRQAAGARAPFDGKKAAANDLDD